MKTSTYQDARVARAADHVGAVRLADGRWAHYAAETGTYWTVTEAEMAELCDYLDDDDAQIASDAYSHWCAGTSAEQMPRDWRPE